MMKRRSGAEDNVKIKPVARIALAREPTPLFAERVEIDQEKEEDAEHAELHANGAAGAKDVVLGRERTISGAECVVVKPITGDDQNDGEGEHPREEEADFVTALGILTGKNGTLYAGFGTHGLSPKSTWIVARNRL